LIKKYNLILKHLLILNQIIKESVSLSNNKNNKGMDVKEALEVKGETKHAMILMHFRVHLQKN